MFKWNTKIDNNYLEIHQLKYKKGYKYQVVDNNFFIVLNFSPTKEIVTEYIDFHTNGVLVIKKGYAWNGASGPTIDTRNFIKGSLVHDALYQLIREGFLDRKVYRTLSDEVLVQITKQEGMSAFRRFVVLKGLKIFGTNSASNKNVRKTIII